MPRISVILPVYNASRYLAEAIDSVLSQTFRDFELLILDDGSTDDSTAIAQTAAVKDSRIIVTKGAHRGLVYWLNAGLDLAQGTLIARMDADDISLTNRFESQVRHLDDHPDCCVVGTQALRIDSAGLPIALWRVPERHEDIDSQHMFGHSGGIIHPTVMMRKATVMRAGGYREQFEAAEDFDLFLRLAEQGRLTNLSDALLRYRLHDASVSYSRLATQIESTRKAFEDAWHRRGRVEPLPTDPKRPAPPTMEERHWSWCLDSFAERNFSTARKYAHILWRKHPYEPRRLALLCATLLGPVAFWLKQIVPVRFGSYRTRAQ